MKEKGTAHRMSEALCFRFDIYYKFPLTVNWELRQQFTAHSQWESLAYRAVKSINTVKANEMSKQN